MVSNHLKQQLDWNKAGTVAEQVEEPKAARETPKPLTIEQARDPYARFLTDLDKSEYTLEMGELREAIDRLDVEPKPKPKARK